MLGGGDHGALHLHVTCQHGLCEECLLGGSQYPSSGRFLPETTEKGTEMLALFLLFRAFPATMLDHDSLPTCKPGIL